MLDLLVAGWLPAQSVRDTHGTHKQAELQSCMQTAMETKTSRLQQRPMVGARRHHALESAQQGQRPASDPHRLHTGIHRDRAYQQLGYLLGQALRHIRTRLQYVEDLEGHRPYLDQSIRFRRSTLSRVDGISNRYRHGIEDITERLCRASDVEQRAFHIGEGGICRMMR